jgi:hypothetical protein
MDEQSVNHLLPPCNPIVAENRKTMIEFFLTLIKKPGVDPHSTPVRSDVLENPPRPGFSNTALVFYPN